MTCINIKVNLNFLKWSLNKSEQLKPSNKNNKLHGWKQLTSYKHGGIWAYKQHESTKWCAILRQI